MITLILLIILFLSMGIVAIAGITVGWWLLPVVMIGYLAIKILSYILRILVRKDDDVVVLSKKDFEQNYVKIKKK